jgi:hypothetical protein
MKLFEEITIKFEKPDWARSPEFGVIDTILELHPDIILLMRDDIKGNSPSSQFGRGDVPTVEQIVRAALYKEMKSLDYRELAFAQIDSRICATFIKLDLRKPYSFQMFQNYISRIRPETLQKVLYRINQTSNVIKKKFGNLKAGLIQIQMNSLLELMLQVYDMAYELQIEGNQVPNEKKLFSIFELHTDIIVKGQREVEFGHKVSLATGSSNLILDCKVERGNPSDKSLYQGVINRVVEAYGSVPRDSAADGGYACLDNLNFAKNMEIKNIVFNKVVGSLQNQVTSKNMETRLKRWRSSIEAVISNLKRGFNLDRCNWKGWIHFQAKVLWSVLAYNIRVLTAMVMNNILNKSLRQAA